MSKTIIITGAGSGIGAATTKAFLDDGYNVGLIGRRAKTLKATACLLYTSPSPRD